MTEYKCRILVTIVIVDNFDDCDVILTGCATKVIIATVVIFDDCDITQLAVLLR